MAEIELILTGDNVEITEGLRVHVDKKLAHLNTRGIRVTKIHVILSIDKLDQTAKATVYIPGDVIEAVATERDMYAAIDGMTHRVVRQLSDHHDRQA